MKRCTAEWITAFKRLRAGQIQGDAGITVILARLQSHSGAARRQRQTCVIINCSARNQASHIKHALVVLVPASTVGLQAEMGFHRIAIGGKNLNIEQDYQECQAGDTYPALEIPHRFEEGRSGRPVSSVTADRSENAESSEVGKRRQTAVTQKRRDNSSQWNYAKAAANHDETWDN